MNLRRTDTIPRAVRFEGTRRGGKSREAEKRGKFSRRASFRLSVAGGAERERERETVDRWNVGFEFGRISRLGKRAVERARYSAKKKGAFRLTWKRPTRKWKMPFRRCRDDRETR